LGGSGPPGDERRKDGTATAGGRGRGFGAFGGFGAPGAEGPTNADVAALLRELMAQKGVAIVEHGVAAASPPAGEAGA
jgi:hypothetical protein